MDALRGYVRTILERIASKTFDLAELKSLGSKEEVLNYATHTLKPLGRGSSRAAFLLSSRYVLKVARNDKGIAQNEAEVDVFTNPASKPIVAKVQSFDPGYSWLVSEIVKPFNSPDEFTAATGALFYKFIHAVQDTIDGDRVEFAVSANKLEPSMAKMVEAAADTVDFNDLGMGDINIIDHWGKTADGRVVILDYGFTKEIWNQFYAGGRSGHRTDLASSSGKTVDVDAKTAVDQAHERPTRR